MATTLGCCSLRLDTLPHTVLGCAFLSRDGSPKGALEGGDAGAVDERAGGALTTARG
jgi:hypothetical protein